jgi:hypothetical protein
MRLLLPALLTLSFVGSFAQKIQGSYAGSILSERNVLSLDVDKNGDVTGTIYLSPSEHFSFKGTYVKPQLRGFIAIDAKSISIEGELKGSSLRITFTDSVRKKMYIIHKVSPKSSVDIEKLYSDEHDMLLIGEWVLFKKFDPYGNNITDQITATRDFGLHGRGSAKLSDIPPMLATSRGIVSTTDMPPPQWDIDWDTKKGILTVTNRILKLSVDNVYDYYIKNDTLVAKLHFNGNTELWRRK